MGVFLSALKLSADFCTEGHNGQFSELKALQTKGNTDDGNAPHNAEEEISKAGPQAGEQEPQQIAQKFHNTFSFLYFRYVYFTTLNDICQ